MSKKTKDQKPKELLEALQDWVPESPEPVSNPVTFIADPFGFKTNEIADAQNQEDFEIDEDLAEADMARLENAMAEEQRKQVAEMQALVPPEEAESENEALLAAQIAEDEALAAQQAAEELAAQQEDPELMAALPKPDAQGNFDLDEMQSCIETLLFMTDKPMPVKRLQDLLGTEIPFTNFQEALTELQTRYQATSHGFELVEVGGGYQFRTKPGRAALAKKLAKVQTQRLSGGAMETLAIIAYRQPALKDDIDKVRGVDSSHFIRGLIDKKLIFISGRSELPGRPMLYSTTPDFLELFGLRSLDDMPSLRELEQMVPASQSKNPEDEDPRVREMRRLVGEMKANSASILDYDPKEDEQILQDIRTRVAGISTSTPFLEEQKMLEKVQADARKNGWKVPETLLESHRFAEERAAALVGGATPEEQAQAEREAAAAAGPANPELPMPETREAEAKRYSRDDAAPEY